MWRVNPYFRDYRLIDRGSLRREGSDEVIDSVFGSSYFPATWLQQMGAHFGEVEQLAWDEQQQRIYLVDSVHPKIFSYHTWAGTLKKKKKKRKSEKVKKGAKKKKKFLKSFFFKKNKRA
ncbi:hypothetical protein RFI_06299 [Reticulomyxa filosa]|uniref:Uncharacterized protein n=1 Tax=Reticulomyxa filosa TaxID=46433 RepID=X6NYB5_RETFI|nr:hypothetical protein RFI_06299 [Reticulomyxa filosa]|eukprot:ETO30824.1 hypothetical protein RFI_06299 [Reticulomyxa filosa]